MTAAASTVSVLKQTMNPVRVMVVDDSAVIRGVIVRALTEDPEIEVVASVSNGQMAVNEVKRTQIDVIVLDIEMPVLDGLSALPLILEADPFVGVIMASTLTQRGAEVSLEALKRGAMDYVPKPGAGSIYNAAEFKRELLQKIIGLGRTRRRPAARPAEPRRVARVVEPAAPRNVVVRLRPAPRTVPKILGIGASTGGPPALLNVLSSLPDKISHPIVIVQHMPPMFTRILAEQLAKAARRPAVEGQNGMPILPRHIYVAPGGFHMVVDGTSSAPVLQINSAPAENFCRPAVDPLFRSLAKVYGPSTLAVILTGMGSDGAKGGLAVADAGGTVWAQDEATSVVWGMPGAVAATGACSEVLPLPVIGGRIGKCLSGEVQ